MNRRTFIKTSTTAVASGALSNTLNGSTHSDQKPNILFIMTDQQHSGMMSCTGNPLLSTPALDQLAAEGIRFENAYASNPVCVPSRMSMATGMMPARLGALDNSGTKVKRLPKEAAQYSMGKLMKAAGYDTFYGGKTHLSPELIPNRNSGYDAYFKDQREHLPKACVDFMREKRNRPFFAVASFINPHDICYAYNAYKKREKMMPGVNELYERASKMPPDELPPLPDNFEIPEFEPDAVKTNGKITAVTPSKIMRKEYDEREWRIYRWIYCRLTEEVDGHIGQILDGLKASEQEDNTLVVFVSDHGDMDASHGLASKGVMYEESVHVPLIIRHPGTLAPGTVDPSLVNIGIDLLPTFCDFANVTVPKHLLGRSLRSDGAQRPYVASENDWSRMIRTERFKYCAYKEGQQKESLVDLQNDPGEMVNLASDNKFQRELTEHRNHLADWVKRSADSHGIEYLVST